MDTEEKTENMDFKEEVILDEDLDNTNDENDNEDDIKIQDTSIDDSVRVYLKQIGKIPLLSHEE